MTFKSYIESGGGVCPKCGSKAIKATAPPKKVQPDTIEVSMFCATCSARWQDTYTRISTAPDQGDDAINCPTCGSLALKENAPLEKIAPDRMQIGMLCETCTAQWHETYILTKAQDP